MFLGVVIHACADFVPHYATADRLAPLVLDAVVDLIHGFRMPLFFAVSGYFTALVWQRRGLGSLLQQRARRVLLPLALSLVTVRPALEWSFYLGRVLAGTDPGPVPASAGFPVSPTTSGMAHLWFLWMLCYLVVAFAALVGLGRVARRLAPRTTRALARPGLFVVAMLALSVLMQFLMPTGQFGPAYTDRLLLDLVVVGYYGCFFGAGAACYAPAGHLPSWLLTAQARWPLWGAAALVSLSTGRSLPVEHPVSQAAQVAFAWLTILMLTGLFQRVFAGERGADPRVRWLADASYWTYLVHFPVVLVLQGLVGGRGLPFWVTVPVVLVGAMVICLVSYQYLVRYTALGALLNGWRSRESVRGAAHPRAGTA
ncbi:hypothetical protein SAMN05445756_0470 [Kytococcus aerolatus]|uniref:Acyltransferase 3 domain-containing protein n=2 Tax=Kytococcus aerolatus TaxID=592308 RepID=A0A212T5R5_9MICO|nr:hypothetical protein SAMN05445756_0470 [Kytococcus aerolatus]